MRFGLRYASLGRYVDGEAAVELAQAAEAAGFDSIWTVEHVVVPHAYQSRYPYSASGRMGSGLEDFPIPDPLIWLAYIASATRSRATPRCSARRRSRSLAIPLSSLASPSDSITRSHSVSSPIERLLRLAEPTRTELSSTIMSFEWRLRVESPGRRGWKRRRRW